MDPTAKFFAIGLDGELVSGHETRDCAAAAIQDAAREEGGDGSGYSIECEGEIEVVEIEPNLGDCPDADYDTELERLECCYTACEAGTRYSVSVRRAHGGEAGGHAYVRSADGTLQIMGSSVQCPEDLEDLRSRAWAAYCE